MKPRQSSPKVISCPECQNAIVNENLNALLKSFLAHSSMRATNKELWSRKKWTGAFRATGHPREEKSGKGEAFSVHLQIICQFLVSCGFEHKLFLVLHDHVQICICWCNISNFLEFSECINTVNMVSTFSVILSYIMG